MRTSKYVVTALCGAILAANQASANGFTVNEASVNGLGGAAVANGGSAFVANPGLLSRQHQSKRFMLSLTSLTFNAEDPQNFASSLEKFIKDDLEVFTDYLDKDTGLADAITNLTDAASDVATASSNFDPEDRTTFTTLENNNAVFSTRNTQFQSELQELQGVVSATDRGLAAVNGKPLNATALHSLGLTLPRGNFPWALGLNTSFHGGAKIEFDNRDTSQFYNALGDTNQYSEDILGGLNTAISNVVSTAETYIDCVEAAIQTAQDNNDATFNVNNACPDEKLAFDDAVTALDTAQDNQNTFSSSNGFFQDGSPDGDFFNDEYFTKVDVLGALISELAFSTARDFAVGMSDITVGATLKAQYIQVIGKAYGDDDSLETSDLLNDVETYFSGNIDLGVAHTLPLSNYGRVTLGLVVRDLIPMSFKAQDGREISIAPKVRAGVAHNTRFSTLAMDIDVTENAPIGYGVDSRYLSLGAEARLLQHAALRVGYRNNLAAENGAVVSGGIGLTPFGTGIDVSGWMKLDGDTTTENLANSGLSVSLKVTF